MKPPKPPRLVELSHPIEDGMITYEGLPGPRIGEFLTREASRGHYAEGTEFSIGRIDMVANTGTYLDSPFHRYAGGADLAGVPLDRVAHLEGLCIHLEPGTRRITAQHLAGAGREGWAVLVHTGWDRHWRTGLYSRGHPFLSADAAEYLAGRRVGLVGIDSYNIDDTGNPSRPAHSLLLAAGIPIVEHLRGLEQLPERGFFFTAAPPRVRGMGSFPVRAFALLV
jgi:kynurenine formamidase